MNNTSPGGVCGSEAASKNAVGDLSGSVAAMRISRGRDAEKSSSASEIDQPPQRLKQTPKDFEWGEALGEGSYSRVGNGTKLLLECPVLVVVGLAQCW
jgi:hypothetical protein